MTSLLWPLHIFEFSLRRCRYFLLGILISSPVFVSSISRASPPEQHISAQPLTLETVKHLARTQRAEITAAQAKAAAAKERIAVVSALEDPMLMSSIDHYPFDDMKTGEPAMDEAEPMPVNRRESRFDWSISVEQRFPLSRERRHRKRSAEAEAQMRSAEIDRVSLDMELDAAKAFWMLLEQRRMLDITRQQVVLAQQLVDVASARLQAATGTPADVLRAEMELALINNRVNGLLAQATSAEAMLNVSLGRPPRAPVAELVQPSHPASLPDIALAIEQARNRPELAVGQAEIRRAKADIDVMRSMYRPMAVVSVGSATTMAEGRGAMAMVGVSIPIWRSKLSAGVAEARAMEKMANADLTAMHQMVETEVIAAHAELVAAHQSLLTLTSEVAPRAQMALAPALSAYRSGSTPLRSVIDAAQAQWAVEGEIVMARTEIGMAWARLERAVGAPLENF